MSCVRCSRYPYSHRHRLIRARGRQALPRFSFDWINGKFQFFKRWYYIRGSLPAPLSLKSHLKPILKYSINTVCYKFKSHVDRPSSDRLIRGLILKSVWKVIEIFFAFDWATKSIKPGASSSHYLPLSINFLSLMHRDWTLLFPNLRC